MTEEIAQRLPDEFARTLLAGSLHVVADEQNAMRFHQAAASLRELYTYLLDYYAPADEVRACAWFVQADDTNTVTRRQRAKYATQGGLSDAYLDGLNVEVDTLHTEAINAINRLHGATHVRPDTHITDSGEIDARIEDALASLQGLLDSFEGVRQTVCSVLEGDVFDAIMSTFVLRSFEEIDIVAGRGYEVSPFLTIDDVTIVSIDARTIELKTTGEAPVTLHYGPKNDAAEISHDFPFEMRFRAPVEAPESLEFLDADVDNSGWFE